MQGLQVPSLAEELRSPMLSWMAKKTPSSCPDPVRLPGLETCLESAYFLILSSYTCPKPDLEVLWIQGQRVAGKGHNAHCFLQAQKAPLCQRCAVRAQSLSHVQLFATPWTVAHQAPLLMEFSRQEYWSALQFPPPGDLPNPGAESALLWLLDWQADSLSPSHLGRLDERVPLAWKK